MVRSSVVTTVGGKGIPEPWIGLFLGSGLVLLLMGSPVWAASPAQMALDQGMVALQQGDYANAIRQFQQGLSANPQSISLYRALALAQQRSGQLSAAIATLEAGLKVAPHDPESYVNLGWYQHLNRDPVAAKASLQTATQLAPNLKTGFNALGIVLLKLGEVEGAIAANQRAVDIDPDNETGHYNLSLALQARGDYLDGITAAQRAAQLDPGNPHPWVALALGYFQANQVDLARQTYQKVVQMDGRYRDSLFVAGLMDYGFTDQQVSQVQSLRRQFSS